MSSSVTVLSRRGSRPKSMQLHRCRKSSHRFVQLGACWPVWSSPQKVSLTCHFKWLVWATREIECVGGVLLVLELRRWNSILHASDARIGGEIVVDVLVTCRCVGRSLYIVEINGRYWHVRNHQKPTIVYLLIYLISLPFYSEIPPIRTRKSRARPFTPPPDLLKLTGHPKTP